MIDPKEYQSIPVAESLHIRSAFESYANSYRKPGDMGYNRHMELKQKHTYRVAQEAIALGKSLGMNLEQLAFVEVIALLHDIGRFEQFHQYGTFADAQSENHSEIAIRVTEQQGILKHFQKEQIEIIYRSILNHNIKEVGNDEPPRINFYSRFLRDADKLDIWRVSLEYNIFHTIKTESFPDTYQVPQALLTSFANFRCIDLHTVDSFYDSILYRLSWLFDLNFKHSIEQFAQRELTSKFFKKLPPSEGLNEVAQHIHSYLARVDIFA